ncbi:MAG: succinate dehydrogenase [Betaproteobacteria bacterium]
MRSNARTRMHPAFGAFLVHRVSGLLLALFLPLHFWLLAQALDGGAALEGALRWVDRPAFKVAEWGLVVLLAAHLAGGLRVLALEFLPWRDWQKALLAVAAGCTIVAGAAFLLALV